MQYVSRVRYIMLTNDQLSQDDVKIIKDKSKFNYEFIYTSLKGTYWAPDITLDEAKLRFVNSFSLMVYFHDQPIAFGRMITDYISFGYIADVFVDVSYRKQGIGKLIMQELINDVSVKRLKKIRLKTVDAHQFYSSLGFKPVAFPEQWFEKCFM